MNNTVFDQALNAIATLRANCGELSPTAQYRANTAVSALVEAREAHIPMEATDPASSALQAIIDYPISDPDKNMDAMRMKLIAVDAMCSHADQPAQSVEPDRDLIQQALDALDVQIKETRSPFTVANNSIECDELRNLMQIYCDSTHISEDSAYDAVIVYINKEREKLQIECDTLRHGVRLANERIVDLEFDRTRITAATVERCVEEILEVPASCEGKVYAPDVVSAIRAIDPASIAVLTEE